MKQNWSKFFKQYTILLVLGSLVISGALLYIDNKYKLTEKTDDLQEPKTITIKKTYKLNSIVHDYNDKDYDFKEAETTSPDYTTGEHVETVETSYSTEEPKKTQPVNSLKVKATPPIVKSTQTKIKKGLNAKNPYAIEYANAIKEYMALSKKAEQLKENKNRATGSARYEIDNQLRKMKPEEVNITNRLKSAQKKYRAWEKSH